MRVEGLGDFVDRLNRDGVNSQHGKEKLFRNMPT